MDNEVAHLGVVDRLLRLRLPGAVGAGVVRLDPDDVELTEILELDVVDLRELAAEDEMQKLLARGLSGHRSIPFGSFRRMPAVSREVRAPVAKEIEHRCVTVATGSQDGAVDWIMQIIDQLLPCERGQRAAGFVHQKIGGRKVPVMGIDRRKSGIDAALRDARKPQRQ